MSLSTGYLLVLDAQTILSEARGAEAAYAKEALEYVTDEDLRKAHALLELAAANTHRLARRLRVERQLRAREATRLRLEAELAEGRRS